MGKKEVAGQILTLMVDTALESFHCEGVSYNYMLLGKVTKHELLQIGN